MDSPPAGNDAPPTTLASGESASAAPDASAGHKPDGTERAVSHARSAFQFSLFELMVITTGASIAAAIAAVRGLPSLLTSTCTLATLANCAGWLVRWQTPTWQRKWIYLGWLLFLVSLCLPSVKGCDDKPIYGWNLAGGAVAGEAEGIWKLATSKEAWSEFASEPADQIQAIFFITTLNVLNLTLLALPLAAWYWRRNDHASGRASTIWLTCVLAGGAIGWTIAWSQDNTGLLIGYYVWCASTLAVVLHRRLPWKSLFAVIAWYASLAALDWFDG